MTKRMAIFMHLIILGACEPTSAQMPACIFSCSVVEEHIKDNTAPITTKTSVTPITANAE